MDIDIFNSWADAETVFAALVGGVMVFFCTRISRKLKNPSSYRRDPFDWSTHTQLHETLTELRVQTDCARTRIVQFHNDGDF